MFPFGKSRRAARKPPKTRPRVEMLDERIVPATVGFDARVLLARAAAERAITGGGFSPSLRAFNAFNRFVNTFDRLEEQAQTRLNRIANLFATRANTFNAQLVNQILATTNARIGDLFGPGQVIDDAFLNQFNTGNSGLTFVPGTGFVATGRIGELFGPGQVLEDEGAFINRFNARLNRLNNQLTNQINGLNRLVNNQLSRLGNQVVRAGAPFDTAFSNMRSIFQNQLDTASQALREGLTGTRTLFSNALSNVNALVQNPALNTTAFTDFATNFGNLFGELNQNFSTRLNDFNTAFSTGFSTFTSDFNSGLGDFFLQLNNQFITPSPGFGIPSTGTRFVANPGLSPGTTITTTTTTF
jgi:hypothetical protein